MPTARSAPSPAQRRPPPLALAGLSIMKPHYCLQAQADGDAAQALAAFALYFTTAGHVARALQDLPPALLSLREDRVREILSVHTKVSNASDFFNSV